MKKLLAALSMTALMFTTMTQCFSQQNQNEVKVKTVLSKLSKKAQSEIKINSANLNEFISDLGKTLEEEKNSKAGDWDVGLLYLIDKTHGKLSESYEPKNLVPLENPKLYRVSKSGMLLRADAKKSLEEMVHAYDADTGAALFMVSSAYRSYSYQDSLFKRWVREDGLEMAERESARPGTSQHQLGMALDFGSITNEFAETKQGKWMYENAWKYGWSLSFPDGYEPDTGFMWESWHFRYVGKEACKLQKKYFNNVQQFMLEFIDLWKKA